MGGNTVGHNSGGSKTEFGNSVQSNPYYRSYTDSNGVTKVNFTNGSAGDTAYKFVNKNISGLLDNYLNPNLNSATNQAKLNAFNKTQQQNLQNNIISPLAQNNMIRSSQATNMYNNLSNQSADYANQLIANNQDDSWNMINNLMSLYMNGYTGASNQQAASIGASTGNGSTSTRGSYSAMAV